MMLGKLLLLTAWPSLLSLAAMVPTPVSTPSNGDPLHAWAGPADPAHLDAWVNSHLETHRQYIQQVLAVKEKPTVENTLVPFDHANAELSIAGAEAGLMFSVAPEKSVRDKAQALAQKIGEVSTALSLNPAVYHALAAIDATSADPATQYFLKRTLLEYRLAGVDKDDATRQKIQQLQDRVTQLSLSFGSNVQEHVNTVTAHNIGELDGLPADFIQHHPPAADGTIQLTTDHPDFMPVMTFAKNTGLRHRMLLAYTNVAYPANKQVLLDLLAARQQIANIMGYKTWADYATADQMIGSAANVRSFLAQLDTASKAPADKEYKMVLAFARQHEPGLTNIPAESATYWNEQYRIQSFNFDSQSVRPYFSYERVQQGILDTAAKLFHVEFRPDPTAAVWDPSVTAWQVFDRSPGDRSLESGSTGKLIGRFYLDMHPRDGKNKWFSAYSFVPGIRDRQIPESALICNFPGGKPGDDGLLQYSDVVTFFHEFGHLMHAILGGQQQWAGVSGISTEGDFVEAPSQMLEEFFRNPKLLQSFAKHYKTNELIPTELVARMNHASAFGRGNWVRTQLFYTRYALDVHDRPTAGLDPDAIMRADYAAALPYTWLEGNHFYSSFTHLTGYSSNYYTYLFDKVIALDFYSQFDPENLISGPAALRYRKAVLEPGGSEPGTQLVHNFLGRPQSLHAFEQWMNEEFAGTK